MRKIVTIMVVLLKVIECDQEVDVVKVKQKAQEVMLVIADTYPGSRFSQQLMSSTDILTRCLNPTEAGA